MSALEICLHSPTIIAIFQLQHLINDLDQEEKSHLYESSRYSGDFLYRSSCSVILTLTRFPCLMDEQIPNMLDPRPCHSERM